jgi:hypothetical protein
METTLYKFASSYKGMLNPFVTETFVRYSIVEKYAEKEVEAMKSFAFEKGIPVSVEYNGRCITVRELSGLDKTEFNLTYASHKLGVLAASINN